MDRIRRSLALAPACLLGAFGLAACLSGAAVAQPQTEPQRGGTLTIAFASDTKTLDPAFSVNFSERQPLYLIYNTLLALNPDLSAAPELAERWETSADGRRLTLHLRRGVKFHDGTEFDAAAAKLNLERRLDPAVNSPQRGLLAGIVASLETPDNATLVINMKQPSPSLLGMLAQREGFIASPAAIQRFGKDFATNPVGTGPLYFGNGHPASASWWSATRITGKAASPILIGWCLRTSPTRWSGSSA